MDATLVFLLDKAEKKILLGHKKTGLGKGKLLGIGGKVDAGETIVAAACREVHEEVSVQIHPQDLISSGIIQFRFPLKPSWSQNVHVFVTEKWQGTPTESPEIKPEWFSFEEIPFQKMWDDASYWLPKLLIGQQIRATFVFNDDLETVKTVEWV